LTQEKNLYEIFYDCFLSKIPERYAIKLGRNFLRFPLDLFWNYEACDGRLHVKINNCELPNPVILSACYHEPYIIERAMKLGFGGVTLKVTKEKRIGNPEPVIARRGEGFVNCIGFKNPGMTEYKKFLASLTKSKPLILNIAGNEIDDYIEVVANLEKYADMFELNISCPNTKTGLNLSKCPEDAGTLFRESRKMTEKPISVKLSPDKEFEENNYRKIIPFAINAGLDIVNFGNTRYLKEERISMGGGGLSGPELYENVLNNVKKIHKKFGKDIKIIATGGIDSPEKAYRAITKGATCVSYVSGFVTKGPTLARRINSYLSERLDEHDLDSVMNLTGIEC
jgi:dihydroorotate dehydrogenase (NAD+) catalytic subunit